MPVGAVRPAACTCRHHRTKHDVARDVAERAALSPAVTLVHPLTAGLVMKAGNERCAGESAACQSVGRQVPRNDGSRG